VTSVLRPVVWLFTAKATEYMVFLKKLIPIHTAKKFPAFITPRDSDVHNKSPLDPTMNHYPIYIASLDPIQYCGVLE
jgi:hypothetical protein